MSTDIIFFHACEFSRDLELPSWCSISYFHIMCTFSVSSANSPGNKKETLTICRLPRLLNTLLKECLLQRAQPWRLFTVTSHSPYFSC